MTGFGIGLRAFGAEAVDGDIQCGDFRSAGEFPKLCRRDVFTGHGIDDLPAAFAMKMNMVIEIRAVAGRGALHIHLTDDAVFGEGFEAVINRGQRDARHPFLGPMKNVRGRGVIMRNPQHFIHFTALRRHAQIGRHRVFFVGWWAYFHKKTQLLMKRGWRMR